MSNHASAEASAAKLALAEKFPWCPARNRFVVIVAPLTAGQVFAGMFTPTRLFPNGLRFSAYDRHAIRLGLRLLIEKVPQKNLTESVRMRCK